ncbi:MAG: hypothetical protein V1752_08180, partial [Candidatus Firestonebacteria bacterium]
MRKIVHLIVKAVIAVSFFSYSVFPCPIVDEFGLSNYSPLVWEDVVITLTYHTEVDTQVVDSAVVSTSDGRTFSAGDTVSFPEAKVYDVTAKIVWHDEADPEINLGPLHVKALTEIAITGGDNQKVPKGSTEAEKMKVKFSDYDGDGVANVD